MSDKFRNVIEYILNKDHMLISWDYGKIRNIIVSVGSAYTLVYDVEDKTIAFLGDLITQDDDYKLDSLMEFIRLKDKSYFSKDD